MTKQITFFCIVIFFVACETVPEQVKKDKEKYVQLAKENIKLIRPIDDINNIPQEIFDEVDANNTEGKLKYLGVDSFNVQLGISESYDMQLDSILIFYKKNYRILYDFSVNPTIERLRKSSRLSELEKLTDRLFMGKK